MQKYLKYLISIFIFISFLIGQVTEGIIEFNFGEHNAMRLTLFDVEKNIVEDEWKLYNKSFGKVDKKKGEFITKEVSLEGLSNPVDWYMKLDKKKNNIILELCIISSEEFLSSSNQSDNYRVVENYLEYFVFVVEKAKVNEQFETEGKVLAKLQKELKKLIKDYSDNNNSIEKHTKKINSAEKDNKSNLKKQEKTKDAISAQGLVVEEVINNPSTSISDGEVSPEYEEANKQLLKLQKNLEKLVDKYSDNLKSINKSAKKIEKAKKDNHANIKKQKKTKDKISDQGKVVEQLRKQLETMK